MIKRTTATKRRNVEITPSLEKRTQIFKTAKNRIDKGEHLKNRDEDGEKS